MVIASCISVKLEENPIAVLEKLVQDHKLSKSRIIDTTSSNSDLHFANKIVLSKANSKNDAENMFQQRYQNEKNPTQIKPVRIRIRESMLGTENKPVILAGKLRILLDKTDDEQHPGSRGTGQTERIRKKSCYDCDDGNDWIPLDRNTSDKSHKTVAAKNISVTELEIRNGEENTKGASIGNKRDNKSGSEQFKKKTLLKGLENVKRIPTP